MRKEKAQSKDLNQLEWLTHKQKNKFQNLIFTTFHRVLNDLTVSSTTSRTLILVHFFQITSLIINDKNKALASVVPTDLLYYIQFPLLYPYLKDASYVYSTIAIFPVIGLLAWITWTLFSIYSMNEKQHKDYATLKSIFGLILYLIDSIFIMPIFGIIFKLSLWGDTANLPNWAEPIHFLFIIISAISFSVIFILVMFVGMFFFNFNFKLRDNFARSFNIMHLLFRIYNILAVCLDVYMAENTQKRTAVSFLHFVGAAVFCIDYYNRLPYYNPQVSETYWLSVFAYFWIALVLLFTHLVDFYILFDNVIYTIFIGMGFFLYLVFNYRRYFYRRLIIKEIDEINNEIHLDARFRFLMQIVRNSKTNSQDELLLTSIIKVHTEKWKNEEWIWKNTSTLYDSKKNEYSDDNLPIFKNSVFIKNYLLMLIRESWAKIPRSSLLNLDYFLFIFEEMNNVPLTNYNIIMFEKQFQQNLFITVRYAIYRLKISIYYFLKNKNKSIKLNNVLFENTRIFDGEMKKLKNTSSEIIELFSRLWDILNDTIPDLVLLERVCTSLTDKKNEAEETYRRIIGVTSNSLQFLSLMTIFSKYITFDELVFHEVQEKIKIVPEKSIDDSVKITGQEFKRQIVNIEENYSCLTVSFNQENLGQILWSSESSLEHFGYESNYFRTFNVAQIMPQIIAKRHNKYLMNYFNIGKEKNLMSLNHLWALNKQKILFSILLVLKMFISKEGLTVLGLIKKLNTSDYIIIDKKGQVNWSGSKFRELLGCSKEFYDKDLITSIFIIWPKLIWLFLPHIFRIPEFRLEGFEDESLLIDKVNQFFFFVHKDMEKKIQLLNDKIMISVGKFNKNQKEEIRMEYFQQIYNYMKDMKKEQIKFIYRISSKINKKVFSDGKFLWEIKIYDIEIVDSASFTPDLWKQEMCFIDKINLNQDMKKQIQVYIDKLAGKEEEQEEIEDSGMMAAKRLLNKKNAPPPKDPSSTKIPGAGGLGLGNNENLMSAIKGRGSKRRISSKIMDFNELHKAGNIAPEVVDNNIAAIGSRSPSKKRSAKGKKSTLVHIKMNHPGTSNAMLESPPKKVEEASKGNNAKGGVFGKIMKKTPEAPEVKEEKKAGGGGGLFKNRMLNINNKKEEAVVTNNLDPIEKVPSIFLLEFPIDKLDEKMMNFSSSSGDTNKVAALAFQSNGINMVINKVRQNENMAAILADQSSIGSTKSSYFGYRDTLKKIRKSIESKSAPINLKIAIGLIVCTFIAWSIVNLIAKIQNDKKYNEIIQFCWDTKNLTEILIKQNKLSTFLDFTKMQRNLRNDTPGFTTIYNDEITDFLSKDANSTLESYMNLSDQISKQLTTPPGEDSIMVFFFDQKREFTIGSKVSMPMLNFYLYVMDIYYYYIKFDFQNFDKKYPGEDINKYLKTEIVYDNINTMSEFNIEFYKKTVSKSESLFNSLIVIDVFDISLRIIFVVVWLIISVPMIHSATLKSDEILHQLCRISQSNITFYIKHYTQINFMMNSEWSLSQILDDISKSYNDGYYQKLNKEQKSAVQGRTKKIKETDSKRARWAIFTWILGLALLVIQSPKAIYTMVYNQRIESKIESIVQIPMIINSYSNINLLTFKMVDDYYHEKATSTDSLETNRIAHEFSDLMTTLKESTEKSRTQIMDDDFYKIYEMLFGGNLWSDVFLSQNYTTQKFYPWVDIMVEVGKNNLNAMLSMYKISIATRFALVESELSEIDKSDMKEEVYNLMRFKQPFFYYYWFEKAMLIWLDEEIVQLSRHVSTNQSITLIFWSIEILILILLSITTIVYVYPKIKKTILYSLSFLLLIPFHIFKENESFSQFLKKKIKFNGLI